MVNTAATAVRQVVLDTETTGLDPKDGHRILEIACVELVQRRATGNDFSRYLNPGREIDAAALEVHGIDSEFLRDKPKFADIAEDLLAYLQGAELVIHNAEFDLGFLNHEFQLLESGHPKVEELCTVVDTLTLARQRHPGQSNNLNALCQRYEVDNSARGRHSASLDAAILAELYLAMTSEQTALFADDAAGKKKRAAKMPAGLTYPKTPVVRATEAELAAHQAALARLAAAAEEGCLWLRDDGGGGVGEGEVLEK